MTVVVVVWLIVNLILRHTPYQIIRDVLFYAFLLIAASLLVLLYLNRHKP